MVSQHVPRAEILAGIPSDVTLAQRVAVVFATEVEVGVVIVGTIFSGITSSVAVVNVPSAE